MKNDIVLDNINITSIDIDKIVKAVNKLEKLVEAMEMTLTEDPSNENFIEGSKVIEMPLNKDDV